MENVTISEIEAEDNEVIYESQEQQEEQKDAGDAENQYQQLQLQMQVL